MPVRRTASRAPGMSDATTGVPQSIASTCTAREGVGSARQREDVAQRVEVRQPLAVAQEPDEREPVAMRLDERPAALGEVLVDDLVLARVDEVHVRLGLGERGHCRSRKSKPFSSTNRPAKPIDSLAARAPAPRRHAAAAPASGAGMSIGGWIGVDLVEERREEGRVCARSRP